MRRLLILALLVPVSCLLFLSCANQKESQQTEHAVQPIRPTPPTPPPLPKVYPFAAANLNFLGLESVWERPLNDKDAPTVRDSYLLGQYYIIETGTHRLYGFNRKSGQPEFVSTLDDPADVRCAEDEDAVYAIARDVLYGIDKRGPELFRKSVPLSVSSQMVADANNIYVGCYDAKVYAFRKALKYVDWQFTTRAVITARPAIGSRLLYVASEDNFIYALALSDGKEQWKFETFGPIQAAPVYAVAEHRVVVASTDGSVYGLYDLPQGSTRESQLAWLAPYATGAAIHKNPVVAGGLIYAINDSRECHAVDIQTGRAKWVLKNVDAFVAKGDLNTYLLRGRSILAVNPATGDLRWILDTAAVNPARILCNTMDGGIYLQRADGTTIFVREHQPQAVPEAKPADAPVAPVVPAPKGPAAPAAKTPEAPVAPADAPVAP